MPAISHRKQKEKDEQLPDKAVKLALDEIAAGTIVYCPGPKVEPEYRLTSDLLPGMLDLDDHEDADVHEDHVEDDTTDEDTLDDDTDEDA